MLSAIASSIRLSAPCCCFIITAYPAMLPANIVLELPPSSFYLSHSMHISG